MRINLESDIAIKNNRIELIQSSIESESKKVVDLRWKVCFAWTY